MASLQYSSSSLSSILFIVLLSVPAMSLSAAEIFSESKELKQHTKDTRTTTHIRVYLHEIVAGPSRTAVRVAKGPVATSFLNFGDVVVFDNILTDGPSKSSNIVGRSQGFFADASLDQPAIFLATNFIFTAGEHNGSSITLLGRNPFVTEKLREIPIVAGTGKFRFSRGYALNQNYSSDAAIGDDTLLYDLYIIH